jgi:hypothetical protein
MAVVCVENSWTRPHMTEEMELGKSLVIFRPRSLLLCVNFIDFLIETKMTEVLQRSARAATRSRS